MIDHAMLVQAARTAGAERLEVDVQVKRYVRDRRMAVPDSRLGHLFDKESFWGKDVTLTCWMPQTQETFKVELNFLNDETDAEIGLALAVAIVHAGDDATKRADPIYQRYGVGGSCDDAIRQVVAEHLEGRTSGGHRMMQEPAVQDPNPPRVTVDPTLVPPDEFVTYRPVLDPESITEFYIPTTPAEPSLVDVPSNPPSVSVPDTGNQVDCSQVQNAPVGQGHTECEYGDWGE